MAARTLPLVADPDPEELEEAIDLAVRLSRMNHLLLVGWDRELEHGTPPCFAADLEMLQEVARTLDICRWGMRKFHERAQPPEPEEEDSAPASANVVALPPRAGA